jgi:hypothetical protein
MENGILYVVFNEMIRNPETNELLYKIGITKNSVHDRYYGLGLKMPGKFETLFAYRLQDYKEAEQLIQRILKNHRENGEWFNLSQKELDLIKMNCETMGGIPVTSDEIEKSIEKEKQTKTEAEGDSDDEKLNMLNEIKEYFECYKIPMHNINRTMYYISVRLPGGFGFVIAFANDRTVTCEWECRDVERYNSNWFDGKEQIINARYPELTTSIRPGARNPRKLRMYIEVDQTNRLHNLLEIYNKTKEIMKP